MLLHLSLINLKTLEMFACSLLALTLLTSACSAAKTKLPAIAENASLPSPSPKFEASPSPKANSPIRSVDFENFTYPEIGSRRTFTVKDGVEPNAEEARSVVDVIYGDVTADGIEDAIVVHSQSIRGSAIPY